MRGQDMRDKYSGIVENAFETFLGSNLLLKNINEEIVESEYSILFESFFKAGMDKDKAEKKSVEILQNNWKESEFGLMKYRPEDYYKVEGKTSYIKDQLANDISKELFIGRKFEKDDLFLLSDDETSRKAGDGNPDYRVIGRDQNGEFFRFPDRWSPDREKEEEKIIKANNEMAKETRRIKPERIKSVAKTLKGLNL